jgi:hypothetical protein
MMATQGATTQPRTEIEAVGPLVLATAARVGSVPQTQQAGETVTRVHVDNDARRRMIEQAAYFHAEKRGFAEGGALQDWLEAEAEVDRLLRT